MVRAHREEGGAVPNRLCAGKVFYQSLGLADLFQNLIIGLGGHILMTEAVVADLVTLVVGAGNVFAGFLVDLLAHHKEGCLAFVLSKGVQHAFHKLIGAVVEGQGNELVRLGVARLGFCCDRNRCCTRSRLSSGAAGGERNTSKH